MTPKQTASSAPSGSKAVKLKHSTPWKALAAVCLMAAGCGLKGGLYIPVEEPAAAGESADEIEIETEIETGTGTGTQTEIEVKTTAPESERDPAKESAPNSN